LEDDIMEWKEYSEKLKEVLRLKGSPVAVTYTVKPPPDAPKAKSWVCRALLGARDGKTYCITKETSSCPGGTWHLGLGPKPTGDADKALKKFLVHGEKLFCSYATFYRSMSLTSSPPLNLADCVIFRPLEEAPEKPDLVVFICNAEQACRLLTLALYRTGIPPRAELAGSACHMAVAYPIVSGEINVSFWDYTARRIQKLDENELSVSVPCHYMKDIVESIEGCSAGTASVEGLERMLRAIQPKRKAEDEPAGE
jgi:uncharacterized protein (DUF169 family)